ncbi:calcium-transporting ATPase 2 [Monosporozyma unispora]|nr:plasma membrane calcium [Kazachstania unispora]
MSGTVHRNNEDSVITPLNKGGTESNNNNHSYSSIDSQPHDLDFVLSVNDLGNLHNPKSLKSFNQVFQNDESNLYKFLNTSLQEGIEYPSENKFNLPKRRTTIAFQKVKARSPLNHPPPKYAPWTRYKKYGDNKLPDRIPKTLWQLIIEALQDKTMMLLSAAAIVSLALGLYEYFFQPPEYDPEGNKINKVDWIEGVAIMMAVVVVVLVGAINDYQKELQFVKLNEKKENRKIIVVRKGKETLISIYNLLVGDIISLQTGDVIPADAILVEGQCEADESSITGESDTIKKFDLHTALSRYNRSEPSFNGAELPDIGERNSKGEKIPDCMLISGSKLLSGLGKAVVTSVGTNSIYGRTMMSLKVEPDPTPLQERLSQLADSISVYGCVAAIILFSVLFIRFLFYVLMPNGRFHDLTRAEKGNKFMNIFITAITVIVVAVPEGLPLAVTLALAFATTRMTKDGNLVRELRACETMGSATAVCSDKTGTLTENIMTVVKGIIAGHKFDDYGDASSLEFKSTGALFKESVPAVNKDLIFANIILNSTAFENKDFVNGSSSNPTQPAQQEEETGDVDQDLIERIKQGRQEPYIGSKTETALLTWTKDQTKQLKWNHLQSLRDDFEEYFNIDNIVQVIPFESSRKWSGLIVHYPEGNFYRFFIKGAAEIVSSHCDYKYNDNYELVKIDEILEVEVNTNIKTLANDALRAISLGHRDFHNLAEWPPKEFVDTTIDKKDRQQHTASPELLLTETITKDEDNPGLILDGIVGIQDPLREGVNDSVLQCQSAGVTVRMVTGDNLITARAIARNCNILDENVRNDPNCAMEGPTFRELTQEERVKILPNLRVLARSSPEDKRLLVGTLKSMGNVVAVTGDGTNDAPALKLADVGFSMGISGTEVAREASDIILMTDNFSAIVNAIKWGRCVAISIKKFIQFQLIVNVTAVILTFVSAVASEDETSVLTAVQLLWVNLIMDTLAALALATDKPDKNIMNKKPRGRSTPLITPSTWKMILGQATVQLTVTFILHFRGKELFHPGIDKITGTQQQSLNAMTFNTFVWLQFFTLLVSRKLDEADGITDWRKRITANNLNFFQDLFRNYYFIVILFIIGFCQVLIMFYGGAPFSIAPQTKSMWLTAVGCGLISLPVGVIIRICPDEWALAIFPTRLWKAIQYSVGLEWLRNFKNRRNVNTTNTSDDEEALLNSSSDNDASAFF